MDNTNFISLAKLGNTRKLTSAEKAEFERAYKAAADKIKARVLEEGMTVSEQYESEQIFVKLKNLTIESVDTGGCRVLIDGVEQERITSLTLSITPDDFIPRLTIERLII